MKFREVLQKALDEKKVSLPKNIEYQYDSMVVYRGVIKKDIKDIIEEDFLSQQEKPIKARGRSYDPEDIRTYSCSVFQKIDELKQALYFPKPDKFIIECEISSYFPKLGPISQSLTDSHVHLFLYEDAKPWRHFKYIEEK